MTSLYKNKKDGSVKPYFVINVHETHPVYYLLLTQMMKRGGGKSAHTFISQLFLNL